MKKHLHSGPNNSTFTLLMIFLDLERLITRLIIDGYLKQDFMDQQSSITAYFRPGLNAMQLTSSNSQRSSNTRKIQIELIIRIEQVNSNNNNDEECLNSKEKLLEQIREQCLDELKKELKNIFHTSSYSNIISEQTIKELVKLMP